jgi:hypothetical protein
VENKVIIVPSVAEDVFELEDNLRAEDVQECQACGRTPHDALMEGFVWSECYSAKVNGITEAMFGVSSYQQPEGYGVIWYLGSDESFKHPVTLVKGGREYTRKWLQKFDVLYNIVDARNVRHIAWLKHIGFIFTGKTIDVNGYEFLQFYKTKE